MDIPIYYSETCLLHKGPENAMENPERVKWIEQSGLELVQPDVSSYHKIRSLIDKVHPDTYLMTHTSLSQELTEDAPEGVVRGWGCDKCSYINPGSAKYVCEQCISPKPKNRWIYLENREGDTTYSNRYTFLSAWQAVCCSCELAERLTRREITSGISLVRPPGHHAFKIAEGFCIFNNTAIAAEAALEAGARKVFVFDWDLHHGNGVQDAFYTRKDVFYASIHGKGIYPGTGRKGADGKNEGKGFTLNIPLPEGTDHDAYLDAFMNQVMPAFLDYKPDIILIAAGFDGMEGDPMNFFRLREETYSSMLSMFRSATPDVPIGLILEGGYSPKNIENAIRSCLHVM